MLAFGCPEEDENWKDNEGKDPCPDGDWFHVFKFL